MKADLFTLYKQNRRFVLFVFLLVFFRSGVADWDTVPTGSMKPTILEGDRIWVNKLAYDVRLPLTSISLYRLEDPQRGEIVVFNSHKADKRLVKRVIGLPGDVIELRHNQLILNGDPAEYSLLGQTADTLYMSEVIAGSEHQIVLQPQYPSPINSFGPVRVPPNHYLMLGDNRDNSADSRVYGFVARDEIIGRSNKVIMSLNYDNYYLPRSERYFQALQ
ncbi:MAG: signal peptidase I [Gammaproteobacteria bacterium]